jgi:hypothetical protein
MCRICIIQNTRSDPAFQLRAANHNREVSSSRTNRTTEISIRVMPRRRSTRRLRDPGSGLREQEPPRIRDAEENRFILEGRTGRVARMIRIY